MFGLAVALINTVAFEFIHSMRAGDPLLDDVVPALPGCPGYDFGEEREGSSFKTVAQPLTALHS
jgi:hypothetical protein